MQSSSRNCDNIFFRSPSIDQCEAVDESHILHFPTNTPQIQPGYSKRINAPASAAIYESNKKAWLADSVSPDFTLFVGGPPNDADTMIENLRFQPTFGFFRGELIYVWLWGQERPFEKDELLELKDRLVERFFGPLRSEVNWIGIERTGPDDGTISGEGAYVGSVKDGSTISEFHICLGELERTMHLQFKLFQLDRRFFEALQESDYLLFPEDIRVALEAYRLFTWALPAKRIQIIRRLLTPRSDGSLLGGDTNRNTDTRSLNRNNNE